MDVETHHGVVSITEMIDSIQRGHLRVPRFQRPFSWTPTQMLELFESIERGLPIGSFVVWEADERVPSSDEFGGQQIPEPEAAEEVAYVLDGLQRLTTLFRCLTRPEDRHRAVEPDEWKWSVYRVLGEAEDEPGRYQHRRSDYAVPFAYLPMRSVIRTIDFLAYRRRIPATLPSPMRDDLIREAQYVAGRIRSYQVPIVRLRGHSARMAVEVFSRLNSRGVSLTVDEVAAAKKRAVERDFESAEPPDPANP
ncbi:DUF262 domain-containing protein [Nonomuraea sp. NPDC052116]|uniref:DUF262 domain-containing protein n=1 Tax=Nonomuraea sp. NPDC052116 TaxID=3155665 RepID=UPI00341D4E0E